MPDYRCANCMRPCKPRLEEVGLSASCCSEVILLIVDNEGGDALAEDTTVSRPRHDATLPVIASDGERLRTLDTSEELALAYDLAMEIDAARNPAERARQRILGGP